MGFLYRILRELFDPSVHKKFLSCHKLFYGKHFPGQRPGTRIDFVIRQTRKTYSFTALHHSFPPTSLAAATVQINVIGIGTEIFCIEYRGRLAKSNGERPAAVKSNRNSLPIRYFHSVHGTSTRDVDVTVRRCQKYYVSQSL